VTLLAAYLRDSGGDRQENSTDRQLAEIQSWALRSGHTLAHVFTDSARPGSSTVGRDAFQEMIHLFRSPACTLDGLVIWSWSRFARDINDAQFFRADLRRRGFEIYSVSDPIPDGPMGRFIEAAIDWKNQQFLADLSKDVKSGLATLVREHGAVPGTPPRGFIRQPIDLGRHRSGGQRIAHRWVPDPDQLPLVRQAWAMKAAGSSIRAIQTATGLYKSKNSWVTFFQNKLYIGILEYADFTLPDYCEPIIDQATWDAVQAQIKTTDRQVRRHPRRVNSSYLLSGIAHCARCASPLTGHTRASYRAYACSRARRAYTCDLRPIPAKVIETTILTELSHFISSPHILIAERDRLQTQFSAQSIQLTQHIASHRQRLGILRRQIGHLTDAIAAAGHSTALLQRLAALELEERAALENIAALQRQLDLGSLAQTDADLAALADSNRRALETLPQHELRTLLLGLVHTLTLDRTDRTILGEITFYYPPQVKKKKLGL
jgi:DNA invertase Pin-like site-specific DNA recombinase